VSIPLNESFFFFYFSPTDYKYQHCSCHRDVIFGQSIHILLYAKVSTYKEELTRTSFRYRVHIAQGKIIISRINYMKIGAKILGMSMLSDFRSQNTFYGVTSEEFCDSAQPLYATMATNLKTDHNHLLSRPCKIRFRNHSGIFCIT